MILVFCPPDKLPLGLPLKAKKVAERGGFEPPVRYKPYNALAKRRFRPLSHLSVGGREVERTGPGVKGYFAGDCRKSLATGR